MTTAESFGQMLRHYRHAAGFSQEELAHRASLSPQAISLLERGVRRFPRSETLRSLAEALSLADLERELLVTASVRRRSAQQQEGLPLLPAAPASFTGRHESVQQIGDYLLSGPSIWPAMPVLAIDGMAGSGKTAVALKVAEQIGHQFSDGQIFVDLHGFTEGLQPSESGAVLTGILRSLGVAEQRVPEDLDHRSAFYRTVLAEKQLLLILDNAVSAAQVAPLFPGTAGCSVLITSRSKLISLASARTMSLPPLQSNEAVDLFRTISGATGSPAQLAEVAELCGWLPLALQIIGARYRETARWTLDDLISEMRQVPAGVSADHPGIAASFELSYRRLPDEHREVFRLMSLNPGPTMDDAAVASVTDRPVHQVYRILDDLLDGHLITEDQPGRYRFHDLLRSYAARCSSSEDPIAVRRAASQRLADHYCAMASRAMDIVHPYEANRRPLQRGRTDFEANLTGTESAESWLDLEIDTLLAIAENDGGELVVYLSGVIHRHLQMSGRINDAHSLHTRALEQTRLSGDRSGQALVLNNLALIDQIIGRLDTARDGYVSGLELAKGGRYAVGEVMAELGLGEIDRLTSESAQAKPHYLRAQSLAHRLDDPASELRAFVGLGDVQVQLGEYDEAVTSYDLSLQVSIAISDRLGEINARVGLGEIHRDLGQLDRAITQYERALKVARVINNTIAINYALGSLSHVLAKVGQLTEAAAGYTESLELARRDGDRVGEAHGLVGLGEICTATGNDTEAQIHLNAAHRTASDLGHPPVEVRALRGTGRNFHLEGNFEAACSAFESAIARAHEAYLPLDIALAHHGLALAKIELGELPQAIENLSRAASIASTFDSAKADEMLKLIADISH